MCSSIFQCNLGTYRQWKIRLCQEIRSQYQTHDDPNTGSHLVVLWRISDFIRNRRWSGLSTRIAGLGHPRPQRKTFNHPRRSHGRNGSKSNFTVYEEESQQKHSVMYIVQNLFHRGKHHRTISLNAHYMVLFKNPRYVSQIMALAHQMYPQRRHTFWKPTLLYPTAI